MSEFLTTDLEWDDLEVDGEGREELDRLVARLLDVERAGGSGRGLLALFEGPSGSGKTAAAALLGEAAGLPVYRPDLSKIISKYIGETENNVDSLFEQAGSKRWILFVEEADALFGQRTESRAPNDRAANQHFAYLLQRIEDYPGLVILATDLRSRLDAASSRRLQSTIQFRPR